VWNAGGGKVEVSGLLVCVCRFVYDVLGIGVAEVTSVVNGCGVSR
jgi:hypothetical protein